MFLIEYTVANFVVMSMAGSQVLQGLWRALPAVYRQCAVCYTDFWKAYLKNVTKLIVSEGLG